MRHLFFASTVCAVLLTVGSAANAQVSFDIRIGPPPPPQVFRVPPQPGPDHIWVDGYWYVQGNRYRWHDGYWTRPPSPDAYWVQPYYDGGRYFRGYWESERGRFEHDHRWDRDSDRRDYRRWEREERREERRDDRR
jgi:hypothetical protein